MIGVSREEFPSGEVTCLTYWPPRDRRRRLGSVLESWFSPDRWENSDLLMALAAVVLLVSLFLPWFKATVEIGNGSASGVLIQPPGTVTGIGVHEYLWAVFALAVLQFAVLAARYFPSRRAFRLPGHRRFLLVTSGLSCVVVIVAAVVKPGPWFGTLVLGDGFSLVIGWDYGALVALGAAVVSVGVAIAVIRDHPRH
jgi:hypothetical protein